MKTAAEFLRRPFSKPILQTLIAYVRDASASFFR